jgi:ATP-binding cassette subfamily B protein
MEAKVKKLSVASSMWYTLKAIWRGDKGCVIYSFFKNCTEEVFTAFFFVYLTQKIYTYIEQGVAYHKLFLIVTFFCLGQILIHLSSAGHAFYIRYKKPKVYRSIFGRIIDKAKTIELTRYEEPDFYDKFSRTLDECLNKAMDGLLNLTWALGAFLSARKTAKGTNQPAPKSRGY